MEVLLKPVLAGEPSSSLRSFREALDGMNSPKLTAAFAYATIGGVDAFIDAVDGSTNWLSASKQFLVGIHHGISEPRAIATLCELEGAEVRLYLPRNRIDARALEASPVFHPKVFALEEDGSVRFLQGGSANLTRAALGIAARNHEFSIAVREQTESGVDTGGLYRGWWNTIWSAARVANPAAIQRYADLRLDLLRANPVLVSGSEAPHRISAAQSFFIEVGAGSGPPQARHQVEFPESLVRFFAEPTEERRVIRLRRETEEWEGRPLSYKTTTYGVGIWRLGMPTQTRGGPPVAGRVILFTRTAEPDLFRFGVSDLDGDAYETWTHTANQRGHIGSTGGPKGRRYGFY